MDITFHRSRRFAIIILWIVMSTGLLKASRREQHRTRHGHHNSRNSHRRTTHHMHTIKSTTPETTAAASTLSYASSTTQPNCYNNCGIVSCQNGGTKLNDTCQCTSRWTGEYCENAFCKRQPCQNGGYCYVNMTENTAVCICSGDWSGHNCEKEEPKIVNHVIIKTDVSFQQVGYICQRCNGSSFIFNKYTQTKLINVEAEEQVWLGGVMVLSDWIEIIGCISIAFVDEFILKSINFETNSPSLCQLFCKIEYFALKGKQCICLYGDGFKTEMVNISSCNFKCKADNRVFCGGSASFSLYRTVSSIIVEKVHSSACSSKTCLCANVQCETATNKIRYFEENCSAPLRLTCNNADEFLSWTEVLTTCVEKYISLPVGFNSSISHKLCNQTSPGWSSLFRGYAIVESENVDYDISDVMGCYTADIKNRSITNLSIVNCDKIQSIICQTEDSKFAEKCTFRSTSAAPSMTTLLLLNTTLSEQENVTVSTPLSFTNAENKTGILVGVTLACLLLILLVVIVTIILLRKGKLNTLKTRLTEWSKDHNRDGINEKPDAVNNHGGDYELECKVQGDKITTKQGNDNVLPYELAKPMAKNDEKVNGQYFILEKQNQYEFVKSDVDKTYISTMDCEYDHLHDKSKRHIENIDDNTTYAHTHQGMSGEDAYDTACLNPVKEMSDGDTYDHSSVSNGRLVNSLNTTAVKYDETLKDPYDHTSV